MPATKSKIPEDLKPLVKAAEKNGYKVVPAGRSKHLRLVDSKGKRVIDDEGPLLVATSPGEARDREQMRTRWIRAGVITTEQDPWNPAKKKQRGEGDDTSPDEEKQRRKAAIADESRERHERTQKIRARMEPIVARIGGWDKRNFMNEVGLVAHDWAKTHELPTAWANAEAAKANANSLRRGGTLSDGPAANWESLLEYLEEKPENLTGRWMDLVRNARGVKPLPDEQLPELEVTAEPVVAPALRPRSFDLALQVAIEMGVGRASLTTEERDRLMELVTRVSNL